MKDTMTTATTGAATVAHDYLPAFHEYMNRRGLDVRQIRLPQFLDHHRRCDYPAFKGWSSECLFWGVFLKEFLGDECVATWAAKPYPLAPRETLRRLIEHRGLYDETHDEKWRLDGPAAALADTVTDLAVFTGGVCIPKTWRKTIEAETIVREMPLFARMSSIEFWDAPFTWFLVKAGRALADRFAAEHLEEPVIWTERGELKDGINRALGVSSAPWIREQAAAWLRRERSQP